MDKNSIYERFFNLLSLDGRLETDNDFFELLYSYAKARMEDLGLNVPLNIYFSESRMKKTENGFYYYSHRFNPISNEVCYEKWPRDTRGFFHPTKGLFVDFNISNNLHRNELQGYQMIDHLIDFAFTLEHELRHADQYKNCSLGVPSFENLEMSKDMLVVNYMDPREDVLSKYFYSNAHNMMAMELDANGAAFDYLSNVISSRDFKNNNELVSRILDGRMAESRVGPDKVKYCISRFLGISDTEENVELYDNAEKVVRFIVDVLVKSNPRVYLRDYPVLRYEYNSDGTKKSYSEIVDIIRSNPNLEIFYTRLVSSDPLLRIEKIEYEMLRNYANASSKDKDDIINKGVLEITKILDEEKIDLYSILRYLDRRTLEINNSGISFRDMSTAKLIFYMTKEALLKKENIRSAYDRMNDFKSRFISSCKLLESKCSFDFKCYDVKLLLSRLDTLINILKGNVMKINDVYTKKGFSIEEIRDLLKAAQVCYKYYSSDGVMFANFDDGSMDHSFGLLEGYDNLYQTRYYDYMKGKRFDSSFRDEFELVNQIYIECQKHLGLTGKDYDTSAVAILGSSPLVTKLLIDKPELLTMLYTIKSLEDDHEYLTKLDGTIFVCEMFVRDFQKRIFK